mmetsp:Transcript_6567/g.14158  ORF Transcript_6567/g.14158 Transcript_6567/m.14158 type:complete len:811 (-) Transcript_6567:13-2445(-)
MSEPKICEKGGGGLLFPLSEGEQEWPNGLRLVLYLLGLGWCFMGVAIVADVFMGAIEKITSKKTRKLVDPNKNKYVTVTVWNATVANLTLMALGSSAPEILLNVIDIFAAGFFTGALGPFTIVGSAAFNLFCITAVCVVAIPDGESRMIKELEVYLITAVFSVMAYVWLIIILMGISENKVEVWEGVLTFLFFPILVQLAYMADKGYFKPAGGSVLAQPRIVTADMTKDELAEIEAKVRQAHGAHLTDEQVLKVIEIEYSPPASRAAQRVAATRVMTGGKRLRLADQTAKASSNSAKVMPEDDVETKPLHPIVSFQSPAYAVLEGQGSINLPLIRTGDMTKRCVVAYSTRDGTAEAGTDYQHKDGHVIFEPGIDKQVVSITIIDDAAFEDDEDFYVDLKPSTDGSWQMGSVKTSTITIIDDDLPGELGFKDDVFQTEEGVEDKIITIMVHRNKGSSGKVGCKYYTEDDAAIAGVDYEAASGSLEFENGTMTAKINITLKCVGRYNRSESFRLVIHEATGGAKMNPEHDGGDKGMNILTVMINPNGDTQKKVDRMKSSLEAKWEKAKVGHANWRDQFANAIKVNGGGEDDDDEEGGGGEISILDYVMHVITCPWKLLFAICPPVDYCGGWLCFCSSLAMIGIVTAVIGDMASLLGCTMGIPDRITAITFVALGTSLPDTFASKTAASQDPYADAAICNVTGSNSVNVFLGLGLPWMIGAIYWRAFGPTDEYNTKYSGKSWAPEAGSAVLIVEAGDLGKSVAVFCVGAVICIAVLYIRRVTLHGELGGPKKLKWATSIFFVCLWLTYIGLSI